MSPTPQRAVCGGCTEAPWPHSVGSRAQKTQRQRGRERLAGDSQRRDRRQRGAPGVRDRQKQPAACQDGRSRVGAGAREVGTQSHKGGPAQAHFSPAGVVLRPSTEPWAPAEAEVPITHGCVSHTQLPQPPALALGLPLLGDQVTKPPPPPRPWATWPLPEADTTAVGAQKPRPQVWSPCTPPSAWPGQVGSRTSPPGPLGWESHGALGWPGSGLPRSHSLRARAGDPSGGAQCGGVPVWGPRASGNSHRMRGTKASRPHRAAVSNSSSSAVALGRAGSPQRTLCVHSPAWGAP